MRSVVLYALLITGAAGVLVGIEETLILLNHGRWWPAAAVAIITLVIALLATEIARALDEA